MSKRLYNYIKNLLLPCVGFSLLTGVFSALLITLFKIAAEWVVNLSNLIYAAVRENPVWLPLLILGAAAIGFLASLVLSVSHSCRGGGIPTSVAAIRGIISLKWLKSLLLLPLSALLTFLSGLPLGTEGPCVQMGTALGDGVIACTGKEKHSGWRRYIMTGGASAGFSIATSSPITAIIFSMEELHKHFSPLLLTVASVSVTGAQITMRILSALGIGSVGMFHISTLNALSLSLIFAPVIIGLVAGAFSILFTRLYHLIDKLMRLVLKKLSVRIVFPILFASASVVGFFLADALGSGHSLIETLFSGKCAWYLLLLMFIVRAIGMMLSNTAGATGGVFLPTLAFGAIIGSLAAEAMIAFGWIGEEHYILMVVFGITAFLGATSRIPLTACVFAIEALGGINNVLSLLIASTAALLVVEMSGLEDFTDTVIEAKVHRITKGKEASIFVVPLEVKKNTFVVGKELRDVLWPNSCVVVSFEHADKNRGMTAIFEGDVITVRYKTYNPSETLKEFEALVGKQSDACAIANSNAELILNR